MSRWVEGEIVRLHQWNDELYSLFVAADVDPFVAGQFTQIGIGEEQKPLFRPYSFVNDPDAQELEFYFNHVPNGGLTPNLVQLKPKDKIWVSRKASGRFTIPSLEQAPMLWCFATGTGLGVFLSILKTKEAWEKFSKIRLVHSVSYSRDLTHQATLEKFQFDYPEQFKFIPIVTREKDEKAYQPRMTSLISDKILENDLGDIISPQTSQVMLCGNPHMVKEMRAIFEERGMGLRLPAKGGHVTIESYWKG